MARRLHLSAREMPGELAGPQRAQARARRHVARMVVTFVIGKCKRSRSHASVLLDILSKETNDLPASGHVVCSALHFSIFSVYHLLSSVSCVYALVPLESK